MITAKNVRPEVRSLVDAVNVLIPLWEAYRLEPIIRNNPAPLSEVARQCAGAAVSIYKAQRAFGYAEGQIRYEDLNLHEKGVFDQAQRIAKQFESYSQSRNWTEQADYYERMW